MLSRRIAGVLRQYPNPEVAFITTTMILHPGSPYLEAGIIQSPYTWANEAAESIVAGYPPGARQWLAALGNVFYRNFLFISTGRERIRDDTMELAGKRWNDPTFEAELRAYMEERISRAGRPLVAFTAADPNHDYFGSNFDQPHNADGIVPWVARVVNNWLRHMPKWLPPKPPPSFERRFRGGVPSFDDMEKDDEFYNLYVPEQRASAIAIVAHYAALRRLANHLSEIADWARATSPDMMSLTPPQALTRAARWHSAEARRRKQEDLTKHRNVKTTIVFSHGDYDFHALTTDAALEAESAAMDNCVGWDSQSYKARVKRGTARIYSVRTKAGESLVTIEVVPDKLSIVRYTCTNCGNVVTSGMTASEYDECACNAEIAQTADYVDGGFAVQVKGRQNHPISPKAKQLRHAIGKFFKRFNYVASGSDHDWLQPDLAGLGLGRLWSF